MRVLTRLEIIPQQLRGNAYGSSADQQLYGKAREPRKKATPKGKTSKALPEPGRLRYRSIADTWDRSCLPSQPESRRPKKTRRIDMGLHHRDYREVQRSQIHTHKSRTNHPLWCGERIVNTDKAGRPRRTRNLEHSLAAQPIQKTSHARKPCVTHSRPRTKRSTAFTAVEESRSRTPQYTEVEWASQPRTSSSASTWAWTSRIQKRSKYRTPSLHPQTYWHFVWHSSFFTSEAISFFFFHIFQFGCILCISRPMGLEIAHSCPCWKESSCEPPHTSILGNTLRDTGARGHSATSAHSARTVLVVLTCCTLFTGGAEACLALDEEGRRCWRSQ